MPESTELRARKGLAISLRPVDRGQIRLIFDDVISDSDQWPQLWHSHVFFTHNDYDTESLRKMNLSEKQFAQIGEAVIARLLATNDLAFPE